MDSVLNYTLPKEAAGYVYAMPGASISISLEDCSFSSSFEVLSPFRSQTFGLGLVQEPVPFQEQEGVCPSVLGHPAQATGCNCTSPKINK